MTTTGHDNAQLGEAGVVRFLRLIRFSHTIFALPFALGALFIAANGLPAPRVLLLVLVCMVCARTAAMLFNRWVDWDLDQRNPRTASRHRLVERSTVAIGVVISSGVFVLAASALNPLCAWLAPLALALVFFYSLTKRFTSATHFFLGLALAIAPVGAWIAQRGHLDVAPFVLAFGVVCWVAGFDLIYATQDYEFDRREHLWSLVVRFGIRRSLRLAQILHAITFLVLIAFGVLAKLGPLYFAAMPLVLGGLWFEHRSASRNDVASVNRAFFQSNAFVSAVFLLAVCADRLLTWR